ncbi:MAG: 6-phosphofructokinase [Acidobacteria bacterium]|nr:6-phosphofructokinase [Acidobacteriota bacterium]
MPTHIRSIGVANGGGDCPGLNAVIRGVVKAAINDYGWRVLGITNGFDGLIWPERCCELTLDAVRRILPRGGWPSPFDRILATRFGVCAADLIGRGEFGRMVCLRAGKIQSVPLAEAVGVYKKVDVNGDHVRAARAVGITFGDRL